MTKKALLIGAGFSYDLGMPLAIGFTKDLFHYLTPEKIKQFMEQWKNAKPFGNNRPIDPNIMDEVLNMYLNYRTNENSNYEDFLKKIQIEHHKPGIPQSKRDTLYFVFGRFFDLIVEMFWMYQANNFNWYLTNKEHFNSLSSFISEENETWIISLNHDLFVEFLCLDLGIPFSLGSENKIDFPMNNHNYDQKLTFNVIDRVNMELDKMDYFKEKRGVNLLKLHGGINEFFYDNDSKNLHISFEEIETPQSYLNKTHKALHELKYYINGQEAKTGGEITVSDFEGKMKFLKYSILTGGYKYSETFDPKPGEEKLQLMDEILKSVDELTVVGYGFGDDHVNLRLYNSMLLNKNLSMMIVDPYISNVPAVLKPFNYNQRVRMTRTGGAEFLSYVEKKTWDRALIDSLHTTREKRIENDEYYRNKFLSSKVKFSDK